MCFLTNSDYTDKNLGSLGKVPPTQLEQCYRKLPYRQIIFMSCGKHDNAYTKCQYRNVDRHEVFKCPRLARIGTHKCTA